MAQYKWVNTNVTSSSQTVTLVGVDATAQISAGNEFIVVGNGVPYVVAATPTLSGSDTLVTLSAPYAGITATGVESTFQRYYTADGIPILEEGDVETGAIMGRLASIVQSLITSIVNGTKSLTGVSITGGTITGITDLAVADGGTGASTAAGARTNLVAYGLHKTNTRPATADLNAGDKWADIDYGTDVCAVYCIVDPATPALDALEAFVATADGKWLPLDNSEPTSITTTAGGTVTLTALQNAYGIYNLTGTPAAAYNLVVSTTLRSFTVNNTSGQTVTVKTSGGTGVDVPSGATMRLRSDGTNVVFDEDAINVPANTGGNVSRWVMNTAVGGTGTEDGANTWTKISTITPPTDNYANYASTLLIENSETTDTGSAIISLSIRQQTAGMDPTISKIEVISIGTAAISYNNLKLVSAAATNGTAIELWLKKNVNAQRFSVIELSRSVDVDSWLTTFHNNSPWQSTTPTGTVTRTSDWSGIGLITSTSFSNGWAGSAYYEKRNDGTTFLTIAITTVGTTTNGTTIFTMPAGYRPGTHGHRALFTGTAGTDGAAGYLLLNTTGAVDVYDFNAGVSSPFSTTMTFIARN